MTDESAWPSRADNAGTAAGMHAGSPLTALIALVLILGAVRLVLGFNSEALGWPDTQGYEALATDIRKLNFADYDGNRPPVYPLMLLLAGMNWSVARIIQSLMGIGVAAMLFYLVQRSTRSRALALVAGLIYGLSLRPLIYESTILSETLCTFLLMLSVLIFQRMLLDRRLTAADHLLLGAITGLTILTRAVYAFLAPLYFMILAALSYRSTGSVSESVKRPAILATIACAFVIGWCIFNQATIGYFGLSTQLGADLSDHSGTFIELAPARYAPIRAAYLAARAEAVARTGSSADAIFFWHAPAGYNPFQLTRDLTRMSLEMFARHPVLYAESVARAGVLFWTGVPGQRPYHFRGPVFASWMWAIWHVEQPLLLALNVLFLISVALPIAKWIRGRRPPVFDLCMMAIVVAASVVSSMLQYGENDRFYTPTYPLVLDVALLFAWRSLPAGADGQQGVVSWSSRKMIGLSIAATASIALICSVVTYHFWQEAAVEQATEVAVTGYDLSIRVGIRRAGTS